MRVVETVAECRELLQQARATGRTVGLVPTMGALHAGHVSLMTRARAENDVVAVSIFVNPLQFGDPEDIAHYPRTLDWDTDVCAEAGVDVVFAPSVREMYPHWPTPVATTVSVVGVSEGWEGASRPGPLRRRRHRRRQALLHRRALPGLLRREGLPAAGGGAPDGGRPVAPDRRVGCPIVREQDGLALSSRNVRLSPEERRAAVVLSRALAQGRALLEQGVDVLLDRVRGHAAGSWRASLWCGWTMRWRWVTRILWRARSSRTRGRSDCSSQPRWDRSGSSTTAPGSSRASGRGALGPTDVPARHLERIA